MAPLLDASASEQRQQLWQEIFGNRLAAAISVANLAGPLDVSPQRIHPIEQRGAEQPKLFTLENVREALTGWSEDRHNPRTAKLQERWENKHEPNVRFAQRREEMRRNAAQSSARQQPMRERVQDERRDRWKQIYGTVGKPVEEGGVTLAEIARTMDESYGNVVRAYATGPDRVESSTVHKQVEKLIGKSQAITGEPIPAPIYQAHLHRVRRSRLRRLARMRASAR